MSFEEAILSCLSRYAQFEGRARRAEFWWFQAFILLGFICGVILTSLSPTLGGVFNLVIILGLLVPNLAVTVRRLHDVGWSGWWLLVAVVPFGSMGLLALMLWPGNMGANRFGAPPGDWDDVPPLTPPPVRPDPAPPRPVEPGSLRPTRIPVVRQRSRDD